MYCIAHLVHITSHLHLSDCCVLGLLPLTMAGTVSALLPLLLQALAPRDLAGVACSAMWSSSVGMVVSASPSSQSDHIKAFVLHERTPHTEVVYVCLRLGCSIYRE